MIPSASIAVLWSLLAGSLAGMPADRAELRAAARWHGVPPIIMEAVAVRESGYRGGNAHRGTHGEIGRMQIKVSTARLVGCVEPVEQKLHEYGANIACGARLLRWCWEQQWRRWSRAVMCYNGIAMPPSTQTYLAQVEREIGRLVLAGFGQESPRLPP